MSNPGNNNTLIHDLTTGSVPKQLLRFASPLFLSSLVQVLYNMVDMIVAGHFIGRNGLSAISSGSDILHFLTFIATGFANAGQVIISQYIGAGQRDKLNDLVGTLFTFLLSCAAVMSLGCVFLLNDIMQWINVPAEVIPFAKAYLLPCALGLIFVYGYNLVSAILRGMGDSRHPFMFIAIASIINVVLDLLFVAVFHWSTLGAALATVIGQAISFICALVFLYRRKEQFCFDFKFKSFRIHPGMLRSLLKLGVPMVLQSAAISFSKVFITSWVNSYGVVASALTGIGNKLQTLINAFAQALSTAGASMIAQCIGSEKYERIPRIIHTSFAFDGCIALLLTLVTVLFPEVVFGIFTDDPDVLAMSITYIPVAVLLYLGCVVRPPMMALINGTGNSRLNLAIGLLDGLFTRIGFALLLGVYFGLGIKGFWYGDALSGLVPFFIGFPYYLSGKWHTNRYLFDKLNSKN